tara:strand:+ start:354 stop:617 length:264 start_codon:yes stop_codon:yes gene_type:complete
MTPKFDSLCKLIAEDMSAGGTSSVFGHNINPTVSHFSSDSYAEGDARIPKVLGAKKKKKKNKKERSVETIPFARRALPETVFLNGQK